jgi:hypothetical protein
MVREGGESVKEEEVEPQRHGDTEKTEQSGGKYSILPFFCLLGVSVSLWFNLFWLFHREGR